jgi:hypothetical protein
VELTTVWVRKLRALTQALVGVCAVVGLAYTWRAAWQADVLRAAIGAAATLAVLTAGTVWAGTLRVALAFLRTQRRLARLERRLSAILGAQAAHGTHLLELADGLAEVRQERERTAADLAARIEENDRRLGRTVEGLRARLETFSKLHDDQAERLERRVAALEAASSRHAGAADAAELDDGSVAEWAVPDSPPGERTVVAYRHLVEQDGSGDSVAGAEFASAKRRLREEFAGLVYRQEYAAALAKGDELANRFPDSTAAADFRRVRPHLVRRIQLAESASPERLV